MTRWVKALAAAAAIVALVAGIPFGLIQAVGNPWPAEGIDLMAPLTDGVIVGVLAVIVWVLWAQLVVSIGVEVVAAARARGTEISVPGVLGVQQQVARVLVSAIAVALASLPTLGSTSAIASTQEAPAAAASVSPTITPQASQTPTQDAPEEESAGEEQTTVTVHRGDTLWSLAEAHLDDGQRWREIAATNEGRTMVDGTTFRGSDLLRPGWELTIPGATAGTGQDDAGQVTVEAGDTLSQIALDEFGDATAYPEIFDASKDIAQPGGARLVDPDHIEPGWTLQVDTETTAEPEATTPTPAAPAEPPAEPKPSQDVTPEPAASAPAAEASPEVGGEDAGATVQEQGREQSQEQAAPVRTLGGIGLLLAAGVVGLLAARRRRQQRRRKPGQKVALPSEDARRLEVELRSVADLHAPDAIDTILRALAYHFATVGQALPVVKLARWHDQHLELYLTEEVDLPAPWEALDGRAAWACAAMVDQDADLTLPAPYPTLVTIGHDGDGGMLLVNLELVGPVSVHASATVEHQVLVAAALELGTMPWARDVPVVLVGAWAEIVDVLEPGRARYVPDLESYIPADELEVLVLADEPDPDQAAMLAGDESGVAVIHPGGTTEWQVRVDAGDDGLLQPIGLPFTPQLLSERDYQLLVEGLQTAQDTAEAVQEPTPVALIAPVDPTPSEDVDVDGGSEMQVSSAPAAEDGMSPRVATAVLERDLDDPDPEVSEEQSTTAVAELLQTGHPVLRLLGHKVELLGTQGDEPTHVGVCLRMATFLALHRNATKTQLVEAIWPATRVTSNTVNPRVSQLRKWLGVDDDQVPYLPPRSLTLDERVVTDWDIFTGLVGADVANARTEDLEQALALVDARPLSGHAPNEFPFAEFAAQDMIAGVVDAAYELARRRYMEGRWRDVEKAAALGVLYEPGTERLWRIWIHAAHAAGNPPAVAEAIARVHARISELGFDLEDETLELIQALEARDVGAIEQTREAL